MMWNVPAKATSSFVHSLYLTSLNANDSSTTAAVAVAGATNPHATASATASAAESLLMTSPSDCWVLAGGSATRVGLPGGVGDGRVVDDGVPLGAVGGHYLGVGRAVRTSGPDDPS